MRDIYYDLETTNEFPQYCDITLVGILIDDPEADDHDFSYVWKAPLSTEDKEEIQYLLNTCDRRISFNSLNFDDLVFHNHGIEVPENGAEDAMLAVKTCHPGLPAHGLKFLCWHLLGDFHWPQFELLQTGHQFGDVVTQELLDYHRYDLQQHKKIWKWIEPTVKKERHWAAYQLDMRMKLPLQEMTFDGGVLVDVKKATTTLAELEAKHADIQVAVLKASDGQVKNANSNKQVGKFLAEVEEFEMNFTATGEFQVKKKDLEDIVGMKAKEMREWKIGDPTLFSSVAMLAWQIKDIMTLKKYVKAYYTAAIATDCSGWIPSAYGISRAATRRTLSKSLYKINFQNSTEEIDSFKLVPPGFVGWWIDSTQVENVVHIYESRDIARRSAYENDVNWNEYVWLCNRILGDNKTKDELDSIKSKQISHWSIYKLYKTIKLAINFGMGVKKFCRTLGIDEKVGRILFADIHKACPAIRDLQNRVEADLDSNGFVQDTFGHIYQGSEAYKVVAYLIQGCGTGSLPKAQLRANYDTLHHWSDIVGSVGPLNATTHDESSGLLNLSIGEPAIHCILKELMENMTTKFSHKFDNIPLRAKLYLSTTNWKDRKYHEQPNWKEGIEIPC